MVDPTSPFDVEPLLDEMRRRADEARSIDPLIHVDFLAVEPADLHVPEELGPPDGGVKMVYESGGSVESSYVIEDQAAYWVEEGRVVRLFLSREMDDGEVVEAGDGEEDLGGRLRSFLGRVLPDID